MKEIKKLLGLSFFISIALAVSAQDNLVLVEEIISNPNNAPMLVHSDPSERQILWYRQNSKFFLYVTNTFVDKE